MLDQKGCRYVPHVFGVQAGQTIQVSNNDTTLHNVHAHPEEQPRVQFRTAGQRAGGGAGVRQAGDGLPFRCDVHGWMSVYVNVVAHPFFAVTGDDGRFEIKGLPAGSYTIELWHEQLGTQIIAGDGGRQDGRRPR